MTENKKEKPLVVNLNKEDRELLKSVIEASKVAQKPAETKPSIEKHEHFSTDIAYLDDAENCPECRTGLETFGKEFMKRDRTRRLTLPYVCENCGLGVDVEKEESCPTCGSKNARKRD